MREDAGEPELLRFRGIAARKPFEVDVGEVGSVGEEGPALGASEGKGTVEAVGGTTAVSSDAGTGGGDGASFDKSGTSIGSVTSSTDCMTTSSPGAVSVVVLMLTAPMLGVGLGAPRDSEAGTSSKPSSGTADASASAAVAMPSPSTATPSNGVESEGSFDAPRRRVDAAGSYSTCTVARCAAFRLLAAISSIVSSVELSRLDGPALAAGEGIPSAMTVSSLAVCGTAASD